MSLHPEIAAPLVRIDLLKGKDAPHRERVGQAVYDALIGMGVPQNDRFQVITEHDAGSLLFDRSHLGIERSDDFVMIQITWNDGRTLHRRR